MIQLPISRFPQLPVISNSQTPLLLIQNLSDQDGSRRRKQSTGGFSPWDDMFSSSILKQKQKDKQKPILSQDKLNQTRNQTLSHQLKIKKQDLLRLSIERKTSVRHNQPNEKQPIPYRSIDLDIPSFQSNKTIDRNCNIRLRRIYNPSKKEQREMSYEFRSIQSDRLKVKNRNSERTQRAEELRRKVIRRKSNRAVYDDLVTREYIFPPQQAGEKERPDGVNIINYPIEENKREVMNVNVGSLSKMMVTNNSFFIKHKLKGVYNFGESMSEIKVREEGEGNHVEGKRVGNQFISNN